MKFTLETIAEKYTPVCKTKYSAGYDVFARIENEEDSLFIANTRKVFKTGFKILFSEEYLDMLSQDNLTVAIDIRSKSGIFSKYGIKAFPGLCDADYSDEYLVTLENNSNHNYRIKDGQCIAQIVFNIVAKAGEDSDLIQLDDPRRGGHGSTGDSNFEEVVECLDLFGDFIEEDQWSCDENDYEYEEE